MKKIILIILAFVMLIFIVGCDSTKKEIAVISGIVVDVQEKSIQIETEDKSPYVVHLTKTTYKKGVSDEFMIGNSVDIEFGGEVMESYPMQINAIRIIKNEITK